MEIIERIEQIFENRAVAIPLVLSLWVGAFVGIATGFYTLYKIVSYNPALH